MSKSINLSLVLFPIKKNNLKKRLETCKWFLRVKFFLYLGKEQQSYQCCKHLPFGTADLLVLLRAQDDYNKRKMANTCNCFINIVFKFMCFHFPLPSNQIEVLQQTSYNYIESLQRDYCPSSEVKIIKCSFWQQHVFFVGIKKQVLVIKYMQVVSQ